MMNVNPLAMEGEAPWPAVARQLPGVAATLSWRRRLRRLTHVPTLTVHRGEGSRSSPLHSLLSQSTDLQLALSRASYHGAVSPC